MGSCLESVQKKNINLIASDGTLPFIIVPMILSYNESERCLREVLHFFSDQFLMVRLEIHFQFLFDDENAVCSESYYILLSVMQAAWQAIPTP